jgi:hypothetical protein
MICGLKSRFPKQNNREQFQSRYTIARSQAETVFHLLERLGGPRLPERAAGRASLFLLKSPSCFWIELENKLLPVFALFLRFPKKQSKSLRANGNYFAFAG